MLINFPSHGMLKATAKLVIIKIKSNPFRKYSPIELLFESLVESNSKCKVKRHSGKNGTSRKVGA